MSNPTAVVAGMQPWLQKRGTAITTKSRTDQQKIWDSAVLACSEYVRRLTDYDENLAGALHLLLTPIVTEGNDAV